MGYVIHFPSERFGAVTRATEQPHAVERLVAWLRKSAPIRASASLGCEAALESAPNVVPLRLMSRTQAMVSAVTYYCHRKRYQGWIVADAIALCLMRYRHGASPASAIASAEVRADFAHKHGRGPSDAA